MQHCHGATSGGFLGTDKKGLASKRELSRRVQAKRWNFTASSPDRQPPVLSRDQEDRKLPCAHTLAGPEVSPPACLIQRNDAPPPSVLICGSEVFHDHPRSSISPR